jgi:surface polysaccharide O-acyltransferase-like enzyme
MFYDLILGLSWMKQNEIILNADRASLTIEFTETIIWNRKLLLSEFNYVMMSAMFFMNLIQKKRKRNRRRLIWELYFLIIITSFFKCVQSYNDWEFALKKRRHRSSNWTKRGEWKESKVLWDSLYNMTRENY